MDARERRPDTPGTGPGPTADSAVEDAPVRPTAVKAACAILVVEAAALLGIAGFYVASTVFGTPNSVARALWGAAMAVVGALALAGCARGLYRLRPSARTPVVVLQLLALPVSYSLAFQAGRVEYGGPILIAALAVLYLLFTPPARAALDRDVTV